MHVIILIAGVKLYFSCKIIFLIFVLKWNELSPFYYTKPTGLLGYSIILNLKHTILDPKKHQNNNTFSENDNSLSENDNTILVNDNSLSENDNMILENDNSFSENDNTLSENDNSL